MSKKQNNVIADEQIIAALIQHGTQRAAAAALEIDERTLYNRMNKGDFIALYKSAKADIIRSAVFNMNNHINTAIQTIVDVMQDKETSPSIRLQAAQTMLNNATKFAERLQAEEQSVVNQIECNEFFP